MSSNLEAFIPVLVEEEMKEEISSCILKVVTNAIGLKPVYHKFRAAQSLISQNPLMKYVKELSLGLNIHGQWEGGGEREEVGF